MQALTFHKYDLAVCQKEWLKLYERALEVEMPEWYLRRSGTQPFRIGQKIGGAKWKGKKHLQRQQLGPCMASKQWHGSQLNQMALKSLKGRWFSLD